MGAAMLPWFGKPCNVFPFLDTIPGISIFIQILFMSELLVFQTFPTREQAQRVAALLENNGLPVAVEELQGPLDTNFIGQQFSNPFLLKIPGGQFIHARKLLMAHTVINLSEVDEDYMLLHFSDRELLDVMAAPDDWGVYNYKLAEALLQQRGVTIPEQQLEDMESIRIAEMKKPVQASWVWICFGYLAALLTTGIGIPNFQMIILPGLFALATGWALAGSKKTLPDGSRIAVFGPVARMHGRIIFVLAALLCIVRIIIAIISK